MNNIAGFMPDADPTTPGVLTDCTNLVPYESGFQGAPSPVSVNVATLAGECRGAVVATKLDGTRRVFASTQTGLYELSGTTWTDRSAGGVPYTGSLDARWSFCQFGDTTIASNLTDAMQSSSTGAFANILGAPKAKIVLSASNNFVLAFNTNDDLGQLPDGWRCCAQNNQADWTPNVTTSANRGRLIDVEGPIQAALMLGDNAVVYKQRGVFLGTYVGAPEVWRFTLVPGGEAGAVGQDAVCDIGGVHFFVGNDNFWLYDGTRPIPLGVGVLRKWFLSNSSPTYRYRTKVAYDRQTSLVSVSFPSLNSSGACDMKLVFHVGTKAWGRADATVQAHMQFIAPGLTINSLDSVASTIDTLPNIPFDAQYWVAGGQQAAYFNGSNQLVSLNGVSGSSSFTTGDVGDDEQVVMIDKLRVRWVSKPTTATATGFYKFTEGDALTAGPTSAVSDGKFDLRQSGRFHRFRVDMTGDHKVTAYAAKVKEAGTR